MLGNLVIRLTAMGIVGTSRALTGLRRQISQLGSSTFQDMQRAARAIRDVTSAAHGATKAVAGFMAKPMALGGAAAAGGIMLIGKEFGEADANARSLMATMMRTGGQVPESFKKMKEIAERLGETLPGTNSEFFRLANIMKGQGLSDNSLLAGGLEAAAKLGVVLRDNGVELEEAAESMAKFKNSLGIDDKDLVSFADTIQRIVKAGVGLTEVRYSIAGIASLLPKLRWTGLESAKNTATLSMMLLRSGIGSGETIGTGLNNLIMKLASKGNVKRMNRELSRFKGIDGKRIQKLNFYDSQGNFVNQEGMVRELAKLSTLSLSRFNAIADKFMGTDGGKVARSLGDYGPAGFAASKAELEKQADLERRIKVLTAGLLMKWEASQGAFSGMLVKAGEVIEPELHGAVEAFGTFSEKGKQWLEENKPMLREKINQLADAVRDGFGPMLAKLMEAKEIMTKFLNSVSKVVKFFTDLAAKIDLWRSGYESAPDSIKEDLGSVNPFTFTGGVLRLKSHMRAQETLRYIAEDDLDREVKREDLKRKVGAVVFGSPFKPKTLDDYKDGVKGLLDSARSILSDIKVKVTVDIDENGSLRVKGVTQTVKGLLQVQQIPYTGKAMTY